MISQLTDRYIFSASEIACIATVANNWESRRKCIIAIKDSLNVHFDNYQNGKCCYCGLLYGNTGRGEIEHIAPKGTALYPQFTYLSDNLAKACQLCNSSSMKHTFNTVQTLAANYEDCEFKIVHPYLDDHNYHYSWKYGLQRVLISINNNSLKAKESIRIFELDSEKRTRARARERNQERLDNIYNITDIIKNRINNVLRFRI